MAIAMRDTATSHMVKDLLANKASQFVEWPDNKLGLSFVKIY